ncbi:hypothetical protein ACFX1X_027889 [Malus domestica]
MDAVTFGAAGFTSSMVFFARLGEVRSMIGFSIIDELPRAAEEVLGLFSAKGLQAGEEDLFFPPLLAAVSTAAIGQANASSFIRFISSFEGKPPFSR